MSKKQSSIGSGKSSKPEPPSATRSANMRAVKASDTRPEMLVRRLIHRLGYRYRLHQKDLPGRPDLVFRARRKILFVHGCFWHSHAGCPRATVPKENRAFWTEKLTKNAVRDAKQLAALEAAGWHTLVIWECETRDVGSLTRRLQSFLGPANSQTWFHN